MLSLEFMLNINLLLSLLTLLLIKECNILVFESKLIFFILEQSTSTEMLECHKKQIEYNFTQLFGSTSFKICRKIKRRQLDLSVYYIFIPSFP